MIFNSYQNELRDEIIFETCQLLSKLKEGSLNSKTLENSLNKIYKRALNLGISSQLYKVEYQKETNYDIFNKTSAEIKFDADWYRKQTNKPTRYEVFYTKFGVYQSINDGLVRSLRKIDNKLSDIDKSIIKLLPDNYIYYYPGSKADDNFLMQVITDLRQIDDNS